MPWIYRIISDVGSDYRPVHHVGPELVPRLPVRIDHRIIHLLGVNALSVLISSAYNAIGALSVFCEVPQQTRKVCGELVMTNVPLKLEQTYLQIQLQQQDDTCDDRTEDDFPGTAGTCRDQR